MRRLYFILLLPFFVYWASANEEAENLSLKLEIERSLRMGLSWLNEEQNSTSGNWGLEEYPALTGLAIRSFLGHPSEDIPKKYKSNIDKGLSFIRNKVQSDGGIYGKGLASYNTSICMMALMQSKDKSDEDIIKNARRFLVNQQSDFDKRDVADNVFDGGIGYGSRWAHSDLSNTHLAMEALYYAKKTFQREEGDTEDLDWDAAISFVSKCQNLPTTNKEKWVSNHADDKGGFVYFPGNSMAGEREKLNGSVALRSYGSMSYAGLLSFIYAEMDSTDPRIVAVKEWLTKHYTIQENPGMGPQGLYYYYHTMSKALSLSGITVIEDQDGSSKDWRKELSLHLLNLQSKDGSWMNDNGRWWERDPVLVSSYALLTLERIYYTL
jgi:squalene-hopene/tetraprenyl-beta-curcumene cyclase